MRFVVDTMAINKSAIEAFKIHNSEGAIVMLDNLTMNTRDGRIIKDHLIAMASPNCNYFHFLF